MIGACNGKAILTQHVVQLHVLFLRLFFHLYRQPSNFFHIEYVLFFCRLISRGSHTHTASKCDSYKGVEVFFFVG